MPPRKKSMRGIHSPSATTPKGATRGRQQYTSIGNNDFNRLPVFELPKTQHSFQLLPLLLEEPFPLRLSKLPTGLRLDRRLLWQLQLSAAVLLGFPTAVAAPTWRPWPHSRRTPCPGHDPLRNPTAWLLPWQS
jgi:hypothetical protein